MNGKWQQKNLSSCPKLLDHHTELKWELAASAADVAGIVDPTPTSDLIGAGLAVRKGDWLGAGMSLASTIPYLGDAVAKPAKAVRATKRINELRQTITKLTAKLADLRAAEKQAEATKSAASRARTVTNDAAPASKQAANGQQGAARQPENKDCEDCGTTKPKGKSGKLPQTKVPCFHPFDKPKFKKLSAQEQKEYLRKMALQLQRQEEAINQMTAEEFDFARRAYDTNKRNKAAKGLQESLRKEKKAEIQAKMARSLRRTMSRSEAIALAKQRTDAIMETLDALHEPDMVVGGYNRPDTKKLGRGDINKAIGGGWKKSGRAQALYNAATTAIKDGKGEDLMNVKVSVCRGKNQR